jgi:hypothetical protein
MKTLRVGVPGVMSGPDVARGLHNKYSAIATANMYNSSGGFTIGDDKYGIEVVTVDDQLDPKIAVAGAEKLTQEDGLCYKTGPNVDTTALSIKPVMYRHAVIHAIASVLAGHMFDLTRRPQPASDGTAVGSEKFRNSLALIHRGPFPDARNDGAGQLRGNPRRL